MGCTASVEKQQQRQATDLVNVAHPVVPAHHSGSSVPARVYAVDAAPQPANPSGPSQSSHPSGDSSNPNISANPLFAVVQPAPSTHSATSSESTSDDRDLSLATLHGSKAQSSTRPAVAILPTPRRLSLSTGSYGERMSMMWAHNSFGSAAGRGSADFNRSAGSSIGSNSLQGGLSSHAHHEHSTAQHFMLSVGSPNQHHLQQKSSSSGTGVSQPTDAFFHTLRLVRWLDGHPETAPQVRSPFGVGYTVECSTSDSSLGHSRSSTPSTSLNLSAEVQQFVPTNPLVTAVVLDTFVPEGNNQDANSVGFGNVITPVDFGNVSTLTFMGNTAASRRLEFQRLKTATQLAILEKSHGMLSNSPERKRD